MLCNFFYKRYLWVCQFEKNVEKTGCRHIIKIICSSLPNQSRRPQGSVRYNIHAIRAVFQIPKKFLYYFCECNKTICSGYCQSPELSLYKNFMPPRNTPKASKLKSYSRRLYFYCFGITLNQIADNAVHNKHKQTKDGGQHSRDNSKLFIASGSF